MNTTENSPLRALGELTSLMSELNVAGSFLGLVARTMPAYGIDAAVAFRQIGLEPPTINNPKARASIEQLGALIDYMVEKTGDPCVGVKTFVGLKSVDMSALGIALSCSASLMNGAELLQRFLPYVISAGRFSLVEESETVLVVLDPPEGAIVETVTFQRVLECFFSGISALGKEISGKEAIFTQIFLKRCSDPAIPEALAGIAQCEVVAGAPFDGFRLTRATMLERLPSTNPEMAMFNDQLLQSQLNAIFRQNIVYRVEQLVTEGLEKGKFSKSEIARELAVSERTLHQKLEERGTTFLDIVTRTRKHLAMQYVKAGELRINQIAYRLGFTSPSNFSRAFKQWTGCTPNEFKNL